ILARQHRLREMQAQRVAALRQRCLLRNWIWQLYIQAEDYLLEARECRCRLHRMRIFIFPRVNPELRWRISRRAWDWKQRE
ncbi:MAG TPA: hypothetical protein VIH72_12825, partial [Candidatus Acidoferrales bacterium]